MGRRIWLRAHLWLALVAGAVFALLGATGSLLVVKETLLASEIGGHAVHVPARDVAFAPVTRWLAGAGLPRAMAVAAPRTGFLPTDAAMVIGMAGEGLLVVMVDPYGGERLAEFRYDGSVFSRVVELHRRLLLPPDWGGEVVSWCGVLMAVSLASGLWLWWPRNGHWRAALKPGWRLRQIHNVAGAWLFVPLCLLTFTGIVLGKSGLLPQPSPATGPNKACAAPIGPDDALALAQERVPGAPFIGLNLPRGDGPYVVRLGGSVVRVPRCHGAPVVEAGDGLRPIIAAMHADLMLGWPGRIVVALAGLALPVLYVTGLWLWWRRPTRRSRRRPEPA